MKPSEIRISIREKRRQMDASVRAERSEQICRTIADRADFRAATNVAVFLAFDGEPDLSSLISVAWDREQHVFLPIVHGKGQPMTFAAYDPSTKMVANRLGILEPDRSTSQLIEPAELDCVLTPLVAFDPNCHRIGVGGGFYDRTFAFKRTDSEMQNEKAKKAVKPTMIGVAFDLQKIELIEPQPWDVQLDTVVTENQTYEGA